MVFETPPILTFPLDLALLGEIILYDVFGPDPEQERDTQDLLMETVQVLHRVDVDLTATNQTFIVRCILFVGFTYVPSD